MTRDPANLSPAEAVERWLQRKRSDTAEASIYSYHYRLKLFVEWCEEAGIEAVGELDRLDIDEYYGVRSRVEQTTLENEMKTLRQFLQYLDEKLDAVDDDLDEAVRIPDVDKEDKSDDTLLTTDAAQALLTYYRNSEQHRGDRAHALLEVSWFTAARRGGLRALDVRDFDAEGGYVNFKHRPEYGTGLKNKMFGQRSVGLCAETVAAVEAYIDGERYDVYDDHSRQPLFASQQGRPATTTIYSWTNYATLPCIHSECPHGRERVACSYTEFGQESKCPSSRSPHPIRSGSITWQLNCGIPPSIIAERVNASLQTIRWYYDWATEEQRWQRLNQHREQRAGHISALTIQS